MSKKPRSMTIGALAKAANIGVETIRYYQRRGLVAEPDKPYGSIRHYDDQALARLQFIRTAQWLGFSLDEIGGLLTLQDGTHCDEARVLGGQKLAKVREKISSLRRIERTLEGLVQACCTEQGDVKCPLITSLYKGVEENTS
ncbi:MULTISPECIES: MerR family transcriptional regulator [Marinobacter]|jgi:MerR family mercuric resistance operon transcriptional regulator|uniref:Mercuric resistance operon regulatory protein n=7 Tax=Marinobacter TaxID=2742 RepID=A0A2G1UGM2_9GAMM|nr:MULTISPECIES: MerR family DNA-binding protein [Marinobacter]KXS54810.1 MAG: MerR family transcriptional regulator, mercuric resistance operon regulatory protein [Marinobacter sp. T13-3]MAO26194.1 MerR family transcriptional regulator [Roseovarius sp.]MAZ04817.1 MerR family transcriptional regulator [Halomonas sp.]MBL4610711.1 MerR family DNA-binding protein [Pseudomonas sp.]MEC8900770.1 MerR family DNA-binding protein [Pseudomonadota bacterium]TNE80579.1 MAG: MerR family transcriptional re